MFQQFGNTIGDTAKDLSETKEGYDQTLDKMNELLDKMKDSTFKDLDEDRDGQITEEEFMNYIDKSKK